MSAPRLVTLVLCTGERVLGTLPPLRVDFPYWQSVSDVVAACRRTYGLEVDVLRILDAGVRENGDGGAVTYLAEAKGGVEPGTLGVRPYEGPGPLSPDPLRAPYASPGGPSTELAWATAQLVTAGRAVAGAPVQLRTWNLSAVWQIATAQGSVWLKSQPDWAAPEGPLLRLLTGIAVEHGLAPSVPQVLAADGGRTLTEEVRGSDQYGAGVEVLAEAISLLVDLQHHAAAHVAELESLGLRDLRSGPALDGGASVLERYRAVLTASEVTALERLLDSLPRRFGAARESGLPVTLVHGDFHPGNVRGVLGGLRLLDWAEAGIGHPALDLARLVSAVGPSLAPVVTQVWEKCWRDRLPGSTPRRAIEPLRPVAALFDAVVYQWFLDSIEPDEHRYHAADPLVSLRLAAALATDPEA